MQSWNVGHSPNLIQKQSQLYGIYAIVKFSGCSKFQNLGKDWYEQDWKYYSVSRLRKDRNSGSQTLRPKESKGTLRNPKDLYANFIPKEN